MPGGDKGMADHCPEERKPILPAIQGLANYVSTQKKLAQHSWHISSYLEYAGMGKSGTNS